MAYVYGLMAYLNGLPWQVRSEPELKLRWIIDVAPCLDPKHPQAMPHTRTVLEPVKVILQMLAKESTGEVARTAKTSVHLVNSLLHQ
ncbi:hypothetical protein DUNSADRAFT_14593 [Dunaliella salina]|uniref:Uncharacterized protein n=1 Tax=Dunaliella salina TaxID=3046 RepID=A0ABQ7H2F6_DUNSA|nr:hypothetical protein DUNSADRAFT_14593 [Dunaliella salina]|eukprot:KAF5841035.1 hypothetical protein DUNSADRAFT_14593 [Dunaliella salina]